MCGYGGISAQVSLLALKRLAVASVQLDLLANKSAIARAACRKSHVNVPNGIDIAMLFAMKFLFGRIIERHPLWMGLAMVALGAFLILLTIALGG